MAGFYFFWNDVDENLNINYLGKAQYVYARSYELQDLENNVMGDFFTINCTESYSTRVLYYDPDYYDVTESQAERKMVAYYAIDE